MKSLVVRTAQIGMRTSLSNGLDITVKSGDKAFAPTWDMVMDYKKGVINEEGYTVRYLNLMRSSYAIRKERWIALLDSGSVTLLCYCRAGAFCHRILLVNILKTVGDALGYEVVYEGEIT
jgi:uncharacterized protein YeaO (DUF488 family)